MGGTAARRAPASRDPRRRPPALPICDVGGQPPRNQYDPYMHLTLGTVAWAAVGAAGILGLAAAALWLAVSGRRSDERKRAKDRERDDRRRAEDRERDNRRRGEDPGRGGRPPAGGRERDHRPREGGRQGGPRRELA